MASACFVPGDVVVVPYDVYTYIDANTSIDAPTCISADSIGLVCGLTRPSAPGGLDEYVVLFDTVRYVMLACEMRPL